MLVPALLHFDHCVEEDPTGENSEPGEQKTWRLKDGKARAGIELPPFDANSEHMRDAQGAKHEWKAIKNCFQCHTLLN